MRLSEFDYDLPKALIAHYPTRERRASRLLDVGEHYVDRQFSDLPQILQAGDLLVFNDTRVIPARLAARKESGGRSEILIERVLSDRQVLAQVRASKSPRAGSRLVLNDGVEARVDRREGDFFVLTFSADIDSILNVYGEVPLPPYLERDAESSDIDRYQTVYARDPGAVAAPTAGLHFDQQMMDDTLDAGVRHAFVTLHVGAGTFQPLRKENIDENRLHRERVNVSASCADLVNETRASGDRVIAVGTTAVRSLECASTNGTLKPFRGETDLFILPGYRFQCVDAMITNFHLPKSSLLMLVAAFAGTERVLAAYRHAIRKRYRFFSYGDCMFLTPEIAA
ncbi:MAG: tRNA preQ1(34) S-adenosylmethionine ribosyltransferase-isomerase QueA [Gammaproteobacteria bacterium]|nr:tRNA preQ1(34) S-adenosylmethionine ribosyltransferase-isomerase QueA [Gammaproteobacteria bacterium]